MINWTQFVEHVVQFIHLKDSPEWMSLGAVTLASGQASIIQVRLQSIHGRFCDVCFDVADFQPMVQIPHKPHWIPADRQPTYLERVKLIQDRVRVKCEELSGHG